MVDDVVKFSPLVTEKSLATESELIDLLFISVLDTKWFDLSLSNKGYEELTVTDIVTTHGMVKFSLTSPLKIKPITKLIIPMYIYPDYKGNISDTLIVFSDDPVNSILKVTIDVIAQNYFKVVDNNDTDYFGTGAWQTSVTQAHRNSSRYIWLTDPAGTRADLNFVLPKAGIYDIEFIVPKKENSANAALYTVSIDGYDIDTIYVD